MTGEITLRGRVLPIGGLKEKLIAAHRGGVTKVIIPRENEKDLKDLPPVIKKALEIVLVDHMDEVLTTALAVDDPATFFQDGFARPRRHLRSCRYPPHRAPETEVEPPRRSQLRPQPPASGWAGACSSVARASRLHRRGSAVGESVHFPPFNLR